MMSTVLRRALAIVASAAILSMAACSSDNTANEGSLGRHGQHASASSPGSLSTCAPQAGRILLPTSNKDSPTEIVAVLSPARGASNNSLPFQILRTYGACVDSANVESISKSQVAIVLNLFGNISDEHIRYLVEKLSQLSDFTSVYTKTKPPT